VIWVVVSAVALFIAVILARLLMARTGRDLLPTHLQLRVPELHPALEGARIALLSDLHVGRLHVPTDQLIAAVEDVSPDILLLGGDYAAERENQPEALQLVERLSEGQPTFGIAGNADHHQDLDLRTLRRSLQASGGDLLINEAGQARVGDAIVEILGVDDPLRGNADVDATAAQASDDADLRIGLCHSPALWSELSRLGAQITLVGHSHGGQVRLPGLEAHFTHMTYPRELASGLFRYEGGAELPERVASHQQVLRATGPLSASAASGPLLYVTRGVGMGVVPVRLGCPAEILVIELVREDAGGDGRDDV